MSALANLASGGLVPLYEWAKSHLGQAWENGAPAGWVWLVDVGNGVQLGRPAAKAFRAMQAAALAQGIALTPNSGFRSMPRQQELYRQWLAGERTAVVARPGYSNHQKARAVDVQTGGRGTAVDSWLDNNAQTYGFARTVQSEPWHLDFVGDAP